jgi:AraC-like DNA-binding protein
MPSLWFFAKSQLDKAFRFNARMLLHTILPFISLMAVIIYYAPLTAEEVEAEMALMEAGSENLPAIINDVFVFGSFLGYFIALFFYVRKRRKYLRDNFADSDYLTTGWTVRFLVVFFVLFFIVMVAYAVNPRTDAWLIPILNTLCMAYLVYTAIRHSTFAYINRLPDIPADTHVAEIAAEPHETVAEPQAEPQPHEKTAAAPAMSNEQMKEICDTVTQYLKTSEAYKNSDLVINHVSHETGIHTKNISIAINGYLHRNFFELVNVMRVDEAKRLFRELPNLTIDSIYPECGFSSRSAFFSVFKKMEGKTPLQWIKANKE